MTIRTLSSARPTDDRPLMTIYSVRMTEAATAILTSVRDGAEALDVQRIDRLPAGLEPCVRWLRAALPDFYGLDGSTLVVIDAEGLGRALWDHLKVHHRRGWQLFDQHGRDRQALVNGLLVAQAEHRIRIRSGPNRDAMRTALLAYRREVGDDGIVGSELVVALALAVVVRAMGSPRVY